MSPVQWLTVFGRSLNTAAHGSPDLPLPLDRGALPRYMALTLRAVTLQGAWLPKLHRATAADVRVYIKVRPE